MENLNLSRRARRKTQLQVDSLADASVKTSVGTRRVEEILQRCRYLLSKKGYDLHSLRRTLKEDEEKAASDKIAHRLSTYFASLGGVNPRCHQQGPSGCSCHHIADWPTLYPNVMLGAERDSDSDDLVDELYSTVYLGGSSDWANKYESNASANFNSSGGRHSNKTSHTHSNYSRANYS